MARPPASPEVRTRVPELLRHGLSYRLIQRTCNSEGMKVSLCVINRIQNGGYDEPATSSPTTPKRAALRAMTPAKLNSLANMASSSNPLTQRDMAKRLKVSQSSVCKHIHKTLQMKTRKKAKVHALTEKQQQQRHRRSLPLYRLLNNGKWRKYVTTDEAWFYVNETGGKREIQYVSRDNKDPQLECFTRREAHAKGVMVWAGISAAGKTGLYFVDPGAKINSQYYISNILKRFLARDAKRLYPDGDYVFHQDSAPAHVSKVTRDFMEGKMQFLTKEQAMAKSPDAAPMDYFVWGWMKSQMKKIVVRDMAELKNAIRLVWRRLPQGMIDRALESWPKRVLAIRVARGHQMEKYACKRNRK